MIEKEIKSIEFSVSLVEDEIKKINNRIEELKTEDDFLNIYKEEDLEWLMNERERIKKDGDVVEGKIKVSFSNNNIGTIFGKQISYREEKEVGVPKELYNDFVKLWRKVKEYL